VADDADDADDVASDPASPIHLDQPGSARTPAPFRGRPLAHEIVVLHLFCTIQVEFINFRYFHVGDLNQ
jgi:hypothetical protein